MFNSKVILITGALDLLVKLCTYFNLSQEGNYIFKDELKQYEMSNELRDKGIKDENMNFL